MFFDVPGGGGWLLNPLPKTGFAWLGERPFRSSSCRDGGSIFVLAGQGGPRLSLFTSESSHDLG